MCVCTISSGSCSLTKFKVDEDSSQIKKSRHLRTLSLKYLSAVFQVHVIMAIPINQGHQIPQNGTF